MKKLLFIVMLVVLGYFALPGDKAKAISLFSPFGGKVELYTPGVCSDLTSAVSVATSGAVNLTFEEVKVGGKFGGTLGVMRLNGFLILPLARPFFPLIPWYNYGQYYVPKTWVLGNSLSLCGLCQNIPGASVICGTLQKVGVDEFNVLEMICGGKDENGVEISAFAEASFCSVLGNMMFRIGTGLLPAVQ